MYIKRMFSFLLALICSVSVILGHGFSKDTSVTTGETRQRIDGLCEYGLKYRTCITSYDVETHQPVKTYVLKPGESKVNCYICMTFDSRIDDIKCSPIQEFYRMPEGQWVPAYMLKQGDLLLNGYGESKPLRAIKFIQRPLTVYMIEVKNTHVFCVGSCSVITHNMFLPALSFGFGCAFGTGAVGGAAAGSWIGPVGCAAGIAMGGILGVIIRSSSCEDYPSYKINLSMCDIERHFNSPTVYRNDVQQDAQAPGKPTENDGFIPKKNWDGKKVRHQKTGQHGWPDKKGNVWVPTGPGSSAHGGSHWDVVEPNGVDYDNVYPGGMIRKGR